MAIATVACNLRSPVAYALKQHLSPSKARSGDVVLLHVLSPYANLPHRNYSCGIWL